MILDKNFNMLGDKHKSEILNKLETETTTKKRLGKICEHTFDVDTDDPESLKKMNEP
jgi:hypothetical protein